MTMLSPSAPEPAHAERTRRILLADDEELLHQVLGSMLTARGYVVLHAMDGEEAVRLARRERPDLILMDVMMPRMSGPDAVRELKSDPDTAGIPVLAVTAAAFGRTEETTLREGFDGYLPKPFTPAQLLAAISRGLGVGA